MAICGIYKLNFNGCTKVYIGQSINIEDRYGTHIETMKKGAHTKKLQEAFNIYGYPSIELEKICTRDRLDIEETLLIEKYDSINEGFNTAKASLSTLAGTKFSKEQVTKVFNLLVDSTLNHLVISKTLNVSLSLVNSISSGASHCYLSEEYPERYAHLLSSIGLRNTAKYKGIMYPPICNPKGEVFNVTNVSGFAKLHGLHRSNLNQVLLGQSHSVSGWALLRNK